ncbi:MAG: hydroxyacid dehydrogenase [Rhizobiaceae bacterium]|jgi:phosphoglycerate dehydrogenase-like enzyme|nr:hydroxyacid dehydrogenase [Rhizobiaceae bacterium]
MIERPLVLCAPEPRTLDLIFTPEALGDLRARYRVLEVPETEVDGLPAETLAGVRYILGQPPFGEAALARMTGLKCVLNVESNLINNMPYETLFQRGIHVVTTGAVFAQPVAEIGLGFALDLARGISGADAAFRQGRELWGGDGNGAARLLAGSDIGLIGFGELGRALVRLLSGFRATIRAHDPWLPPSLLIEHGVVPATLDEVLATSDTLFCVASVTSENEGFLGADAFARMKQGAAFILLSRAGVVDFDALMEAVARGHITAASDVFPQEPLAAGHRVRSLPGFLLSAHRAGALDVAFKRMGEMVLEDMALMDKGLPPMRCKRAERETVARMRSKPVSRN